MPVAVDGRRVLDDGGRIVCLSAMAARYAPRSTPGSTR